MEISPLQARPFKTERRGSLRKKREPGAFSCRFMAGKPMLETISRLGSESSFLIFSEMAATMKHEALNQS